MLTNNTYTKPVKLSLVIPCYNEENTLKACIERVQSISDDYLELELIIVDDCSDDASFQIAQDLARTHNNIKVIRHSVNQGKGAALKTGFSHATGDFIGIQDADLEYNPKDLRRLIIPLVEGRADVVFGSRYLYSGERRILYFWHSLMNRSLTFLSNMFSDLGLTDMETCYKIFRKEIIQSIQIAENRFGFEPEIVAKVSELRCRVYEAPISYDGRTYAEGKKINWKDGLRALYCILHYGAHSSPLPVQFIIYIFIGSFAALFNLVIFMLLINLFPVSLSALAAFYGAAAFNYWLCVHLLFRKNIRWGSWTEQAVYFSAVTGIALIDMSITMALSAWGTGVLLAKMIASGLVVVLNFLVRKYVVFPEKPPSDWK